MSTLAEEEKPNEKSTYARFNQVIYVNVVAAPPTFSFQPVCLEGLNHG